MNVAYATCESVGIKITAREPEAQAECDATIALIDAYLHGFAEPTGKCLKCGTPTTGLMGALMGGMEWGLVHGEMRCRTCKWPGRGYHPIKDEKGDDLFEQSLQLCLQYHPDFVTEKAQQPASV